MNAIDYAKCAKCVEAWKRGSVEEGFPELPVTEVDLFIATLVIGNNLGEAWVETNIEAPGPAKLFSESRTR